MAGLGAPDCQHRCFRCVGHSDNYRRSWGQFASFPVGQPLVRLDHYPRAAVRVDIPGDLCSLHLWNVEAAQARPGLDASATDGNRASCFDRPTRSGCRRPTGDGNQQRQSQRPGAVAKNLGKTTPQTTGMTSQAHKSLLRSRTGRYELEK